MIMSDRIVQLVIQGLVAVLLLVLAGVYVYTGGAVPEWVIAALMAVLGALFGFAAANGANNYRKTKR